MILQSEPLAYILDPKLKEIAILRKLAINEDLTRSSGAICVEIHYHHQVTIGFIVDSSYISSMALENSSALNIFTNFWTGNFPCR